MRKKSSKSGHWWSYSIIMLRMFLNQFWTSQPAKRGDKNVNHRRAPIMLLQIPERLRKAACERSWFRAPSKKYEKCFEKKLFSLWFPLRLDFGSEKPDAKQIQFHWLVLASARVHTQKLHAVHWAEEKWSCPRQGTRDAPHAKLNPIIFCFDFYCFIYFFTVFNVNRASNEVGSRWNNIQLKAENDSVISICRPELGLWFVVKLVLSLYNE